MSEPQTIVGSSVIATRELSLARWNDSRGRSCGAWLVRELPGIALTSLCRKPGEPRQWWVTLLYNYRGHAPDPAAARLWGVDYRHLPAEALYFSHRTLRRGYRTRAELLEALHAVLALRLPRDAALSEALCR